jgi:hypothetical protein
MYDSVVVQPNISEIGLVAISVELIFSPEALVLKRTEKLEFEL